MDHHTAMSQAFYSRCEPPPLHPCCIPVFGSSPDGGEEPEALNADYYVSNVDHHQPSQHEPHQIHHAAYETLEDYRSPPYAYYAPYGPPPYCVDTETGGSNAVGVPGNLRMAGLDPPMRVDVNMARYSQRPAVPSSPVYAAQQQVMVAAPRASASLPLASEHWTHTTINGPPALRRSRETFEMADQHHIGVQQHGIGEERAGFDWLPVVPNTTPITDSMFASRVYPTNGSAAMKEQEHAVMTHSETGASTIRTRTRSARVSRSKTKKECNNGDGSVPKFQCFLCAKQYCRRSTLKTHLRHHSGERPYFCSICGKSFAQAANLTAHKRIHTGEKPFACPICCRPFSQSSSLVTHKRTHTGEKPYQCPRCDKAFTDSSTLTKHVRTHTGVKPYSCGICLLSFSQSGNLNRHMKTHLKQQQQQPQDLENGQEANEDMRYQVNATSIFQQSARMI